MLINITNRRRQYIIQNLLVRMMISIERKYIPKFEKIILKQYTSAASRVRRGRRNTVNGVIDVYLQEIIFFLRSLYRVTANTFLDFAINDITNSKMIFSYEKKGLVDTFWDTMNKFIAVQSLRKAKTLNTFTKVLVGRVIKKGLDEGLTNQEISKNIISKGLIDKKWRADRIVRTETHTASVKSVREAIGSTGIVKTKQWVHSGDSRVRVKPYNHRSSEIQKFDLPYQRSGLMYPGDPLGAAADIIHCRCIETYHTSRGESGVFEGEL